MTANIKDLIVKYSNLKADLHTLKSIRTQYLRISNQSTGYSTALENIDFQIKTLSEFLYNTEKEIEDTPL